MKWNEKKSDNETFEEVILDQEIMDMNFDRRERFKQRSFTSKEVPRTIVECVDVIEYDEESPHSGQTPF